MSSTGQSVTYFFSLSFSASSPLLRSPAHERCCRPPETRTCRHTLSGEIPQRTCVSGFGCSSCSFHRERTGDLARDIPVGERVYHRGHTWVCRNEDGTATVGIDEIGRRLLGGTSAWELPVPGAHLEANALLGKVRGRGASVRVLSPITGDVVGQFAGEEGFCLRVRLSNDGGHFESLLRGAEADGWMMRERERLELSFSREAGIAALADGGEIVENPGGQLSDRERSRVLGEFFLDF
jgi:hypothetical protein